MTRTRFLMAAAGLTAAAVFAGGALAAEVTLKGVSAFADGTTFTKNFQRFVEKVNETGKGVVQINYVGGGGKVMNPFELGNAINASTPAIKSA